MARAEPDGQQQRPAPVVEAGLFRHIGIIGCSAEGAALCYRTIIAEAAQLAARQCTAGGDGLPAPTHCHPEVTLHTPNLQEYIRCIDKGDWPGVHALMHKSARVLKQAGAALCVCPDNTIHQAIPRAAAAVPGFGFDPPLLHIAAVVADSAKARAFTRVGVLGTRWLVSSTVYPDAFEAHGIAVVRPAADDVATVHALIMGELTYGRVTPETVATFQSVVQRLKDDAGCDAVVLGCTEIPLVLGDDTSPLPVLDSTRLLARAALQAAVVQPKAQTEGSVGKEAVKKEESSDSKDQPLWKRMAAARAAAHATSGVKRERKVKKEESSDSEDQPLWKRMAAARAAALAAAADDEDWRTAKDKRRELIRKEAKAEQKKELQSIARTLLRRPSRRP